MQLWNGQSVTIVFRALSVSTSDGFSIVSPVSALAPVALRPNEAVLLPGPTIPAGHVGSVHLEISEDFAQRYGFWSGKLTAIEAP